MVYLPRLYVDCLQFETAGSQCIHPQIGIATRGKSASQANARFWFTRGSEMSTEKWKMGNGKCRIENADSHRLLAECLKLDDWYLLNFSFFNNH
jgi:hypothetical protein